MDLVFTNTLRDSLDNHLEEWRRAEQLQSGTESRAIGICSAQHIIFELARRWEIAATATECPRSVFATRYGSDHLTDATIEQ